MLTSILLAPIPFDYPPFGSRSDDSSCCFQQQWRSDILACDEIVEPQYAKLIARMSKLILPRESACRMDHHPLRPRMTPEERLGCQPQCVVPVLIGSKAMVVAANFQVHILRDEHCRW